MSLYEKAKIIAAKAARDHHAAYMKELGWDPTFVRSSVPIKRSKCGNMPTDRLYRRRGYLIYMIENNSSDFDNRINFVMRAAELRYIEDELERRGDHNRRTTR